MPLEPISQPLPLAIFFDLDDTLLDTTGQLVPAAHLEAAQAMIGAGLSAPLAQVYAARRLAAEQSPRGDTTLLAAQALGQVTPAILEAGRRAFLERDIGAISLEPGVEALLQRLVARSWLYLVTSGHPPTQAAKVQALDIEKYFRKVCYVPPGPSKLDAFARLLSEEGIPPARGVVVGDRPDAELAAGRTLGLWTVRIRRGEHARSEPRGPLEVPHVELDSVLGLEGALSRLGLE